MSGCVNALFLRSLYFCVTVRVLVEGVEVANVVNRQLNPIIFVIIKNFLIDEPVGLVVRNTGKPPRTNIYVKSMSHFIYICMYLKHIYVGIS